MLGLGNSITSGSVVSEFSPIEIDALVAWWDFTDISTLWTDEGSVKVGAADDNIMRVDNKAFTLQDSNKNAMGTYFQSSTTDTTKNPLYGTGGQNGKPYAIFNGSSHYLAASKTIGNTDTDKLSHSTLNGTALTVFYVVKSDVTSVTGDKHLFQMQGANASDNFQLYINDATEVVDGVTQNIDRWEWDTQDDSGRTHTLMNCGQNITDVAEYWTVELDSTSSSSFYRNGDTSDGVTNGSGDDFNIDFSANDTDVAIILGGKSSSSQLFDGNVYEIIMYDAALTDAEITKVEGYLASKYGL